MTGVWRLVLACAALLAVIEGAATQPTVTQSLSARAAAGAKAVIEAARKRC